MFAQLIENRREQFLDLCLQHKVVSLFVFGSYAKGNESPDSDVDLLVDIVENDPVQKGELLMSFWDALETFFKRKVDLLTPNSLRNPYLKKDIDESKRLVFDGQKKEIFI